MHDPTTTMATQQAVKSIALIGGTHGNEVNGVVLARYFQQLLKDDPDCIKRIAPSVESFQVVFSNPKAIEINRRYFEEDMNRCFLKADLQKDWSGENGNYERRRALELNAILGPKGSADCKTDLVIDLHTTSAATGINFIMSPHDEISRGLCNWVEFKGEGARGTPNPSRKNSDRPAPLRTTFWNPACDDWGMLPSVGRSGFTLEVGSIGWGLLDPALYVQTREVMFDLLRAVEIRNRAVKGEVFPRQSPPHLSFPAGYSFSLDPSFQVFENAGIPVDFPPLSAKEEDSRAAFEASVGAGGKRIQSSVDAMIHPRLIGGDYEVGLKNGDAAFLRLDGKTEVGMKEDKIADGETAYPYFVNEAAYYEKGIAFMLAKKVSSPTQVAYGPEGKL